MSCAFFKVFEVIATEYSYVHSYIDYMRKLFIEVLIFNFLKGGENFGTTKREEKQTCRTTI